MLQSPPEIRKCLLPHDWLTYPRQLSSSIRLGPIYPVYLVSCSVSPALRPALVIDAPVQVPGRSSWGTATQAAARAGVAYALSFAINVP